jgi:hypothetical protein
MRQRSDCAALLESYLRGGFRWQADVVMPSGNCAEESPHELDDVTTTELQLAVTAVGGLGVRVAGPEQGSGGEKVSDLHPSAPPDRRLADEVAYRLVVWLEHVVSEDDRNKRDSATYAAPVGSG